MKKRILEYFNWKQEGNQMNPEESTEGFDLSDLEPKAEIGEGLDLKADEAYADHENPTTLRNLFNTYVDKSLYGESRRFLDIAMRWEKLINDKEDSSN